MPPGVDEATVERTEASAPLRNDSSGLLLDGPQRQIGNPQPMNDCITSGGSVSLDSGRQPGAPQRMGDGGSSGGGLLLDSRRQPGASQPTGDAGGCSSSFTLGRGRKPDAPHVVDLISNDGGDGIVDSPGFRLPTLENPTGGPRESWTPRRD